MNKLALNIWPLNSRYPPFNSSKFKTLTFLLKYADINQSTVIKTLFTIFFFLFLKHLNFSKTKIG